MTHEGRLCPSDLTGWSPRPVFISSTSASVLLRRQLPSLLGILQLQGLGWRWQRPRSSSAPDGSQASGQAGESPGGLAPTLGLQGLVPPFSLDSGQNPGAQGWPGPG